MLLFAGIWTKVNVVIGGSMTEEYFCDAWNAAALILE